MRRLLFVAVLVAALLLPVVAQAVLLAGAARVDLTPQLPGPAGQKICLGGYGARNAKPAQGVHDPVCARALVLSDGQQKLCFLSLDATQPPVRLKPDLLARLKDLGFGSGGFIVGASHSHSAPDNHSDQGPLIAAAFGARSQYLYDKFLEGALAAVTQAHAALRPAVVGCARTNLVDMSHNRRGEQGGRASDPALSLLRVDGQDGQPIALLFNFTAHPTILDDDNMLISAEWPGAAETALEQALPGAVALFFNGAEGDQSPSTGRFGAKFDAVAGFGGEIAKQALALRGQAKTAPAVRLAVASAELALPKPEVSPAFMEITGKEYGISREIANAALGALTSKSVEQSVVVVGDMVLITVPGEMVSEPLGLGLKAMAAQAGFACPVVVGLSPLDISYILDQKGYQAGGYEASMSFYGPGLGQALVDGLTRLVAQVKAK